MPNPCPFPDAAVQGTECGAMTKGLSIDCDFGGLPAGGTDFDADAES